MKSNKENAIEFAKFILDKKLSEAVRGGNSISYVPKEFMIMKIFLEEKGDKYYDEFLKSKEYGEY